MIQAVIVGLGCLGKHIVHSLKTSDKLRIVCWIDIKPEAVEGFANEHELQLCADLQVALDDPDVQAASGGASYPIPEDQKLHNIAVLEAVFSSVANGQAVPVP